MASNKKKNKERNCNSNHGFALKEKNLKIKRLLYYNSSQRRDNKMNRYDPNNTEQ